MTWWALLSSVGLLATGRAGGPICVICGSSIQHLASGGRWAGKHADGPAGGHAQAALAASIFHFRETTVGEVKRRLLELGIPVRRPLG